MLRVLSAVVAIGLFSGCGGTNATSPTPTPPIVPAMFQFSARDIVYRRAAGTDRVLSLFIGTGTTTNNISFQCNLRPETGTDDWPCFLPITLFTNVDYWLYLLPEQRPFTGIDGLLGGEVSIRNQRVSRKIRISDFAFRQFTDAAAFRVVDGRGTIE